MREGERMRCPICKENKSGIYCACGYCRGCINEYGHDYCFELEQSERKEKCKILNNEKVKE